MELNDNKVIRLLELLNINEFGEKYGIEKLI